MDNCFYLLVYLSYLYATIHLFSVKCCSLLFSSVAAARMWHWSRISHSSKCEICSTDPPLIHLTVLENSRKDNRKFAFVLFLYAFHFFVSFHFFFPMWFLFQFYFYCVDFMFIFNFLFWLFSFPFVMLSQVSLFNCLSLPALCVFSLRGFSLKLWVKADPLLGEHFTH
jgi:hypothetical protein